MDTFGGYECDKCGGPAICHTYPWGETYECRECDWFDLAIADDELNTRPEFLGVIGAARSDRQRITGLA